MEGEDEQERQDSLDALEVECDLATSRSAIYQQDLRRYHTRRVKSRIFQEGHLVLRLIQDHTGMHTLSPPWEELLVISKSLHNGSYYLSDLRPDKPTSEEETTRPWNIAHLQPY